jgi:4-aminobutyrate aminotransferase-like enzyme
VHERDVLKAHESSGAANRGLAQDLPLFVRAKGARLWDSDGREYVDFGSGSGVANAGYGNGAITEAVIEQVQEGLYHVGPLLATPAKAHVIERLLELSPRGLNRVHLTATGGEGTEAALKIVRHHTKRQSMIAFWGAFHGRTMGALALTAHRSSRDPFFPLTLGTAHFPYPYSYRNPFGLSSGEEGAVLERCLGLLDAALGSPASGLSPIGAIFVEPIQGVGGIVVPPKGFLNGLRAICDRHEVLLVVDECFCGFGRTGAWFGCDHEDVLPDLMIVSKGLSGAFPIAGVVGREELMGTLPGGLQSTSFEGNPVACAAAVASMDFLKSIDAPQRARAISEQIATWTAHHPFEVVGEARGKGALWGLELVHPGTRDPWPEAAQQVHRNALAGGLVLYRGGHHGNVIGLIPPLVATPEELDTGLQVLEAMLSGIESRAAAPAQST